MNEKNYKETKCIKYITIKCGCSTKENGSILNPTGKNKTGYLQKCRNMKLSSRRNSQGVYR